MQDYKCRHEHVYCGTAAPVDLKDLFRPSFCISSFLTIGTLKRSYRVSNHCSVAFFFSDHLPAQTQSWFFSESFCRRALCCASTVSGVQAFEIKNLPIVFTSVLALMWKKGAVIATIGWKQ